MVVTCCPMSTAAQSLPDAFATSSVPLVADQGGTDQCSESRIQLIRRFAAAAVLAEQMEAELARGKSIDIREHALLCSTMVRVARQIGVKRVPRNVTPSLSDYLELKAHEEQEQ